MKRILALSAVAAGLLGSTAGLAAVVPVSVVLDIKGPGATLDTSIGSLIVQGAALASPVSIKDGDTLQYTITFAGNEAISVSGGDAFVTRLQAVAGSNNTPTLANGTLKLLGANVTSQSVTGSAQDSVTDTIDAVANFNPALPDPVLITGLYWEGTVNYTNFADNLGTARLFDTPSFQIFADTITVSGGVPEPATWAMMVIGFGAVGAGLRSRRTSVKFA